MLWHADIATITKPKVHLLKTLMSGCLYVVATPIGNLQDLSSRAVNVLSSVAIIAAEDTRRTAALLTHCGVQEAKLVALHDHNEAQSTQSLLTALREGSDVALVSDAGTPLVSDPGFELVRDCWAQQIRIVPVPGASAVSTVISVCPLPVDRFRFEGFLPAKTQARQRRLHALCAAPEASVFFEAPHRIESSLRALSALAPARRLMIGRELTKTYEHLLCGTADELLKALREQDAVRGEFVCVLEANRQADSHSLDVDRGLRALVKELPPSKAARMAAEIYGGSRSDYYDRAVALSTQDKPPSRNS